MQKAAEVVREGGNGPKTCPSGRGQGIGSGVTSSEWRRMERGSLRRAEASRMVEKK